MMEGTIGSFAACRQIGSGKRIVKRWRSRWRQRKERCYSQKLSGNAPQSHDFLGRVYYPGKLRYSSSCSCTQPQKSAACALTGKAMPANIQGMAYSFLIFEFGGDEDAVQQARHRIEGWKQGFRLDKKLQLKIERKVSGEKHDTGTETSSRSSERSPKEKSPSKKKAKSAHSAEPKAGANSPSESEIRMIVRLDFSDHEKLSHQRWLERIPAEEPFKAAKPRVLRPGEQDFATTEELFETLD